MNQKIISGNLLLERLKSVKPVFGLRQALRKSKTLICVFQNYPYEKSLQSNPKVRFFDVETHQKLSSLFNRHHIINVIGF